MATQWHKEHPFPETVTDQQKEEWRMQHRENCNCARKMLQYRQVVRQ